MRPLTIYLDSNVLFSASYIAHSWFVVLWQTAGITPVTSLFALNEVRRHIRLEGQQARFDALAAKTSLVKDADEGWIPAYVNLAKKDRPILAAAIAAQVDFLVTGDRHHFEHLYGQRVAGVSIVFPADFRRDHLDRLDSPSFT